MFYDTHINIRPKCSKCGRPLDTGSNIQLTGKGLGSFKCSSCNTKAVQISRRAVYKEFMESFRGISKPEAE